MTTPRDDDTWLRHKVAFLRSAAAYPGGVTGVDVHETHMSWVFLTDRRVYKMKKPVRHPFLDYSTLERRGAMCREEVRLNRRLASWVYLGVARLTADAAGELRLGGQGRVVEWLVEMERLPTARMLDRALATDTVEAAEVERALHHLIGFYRGSPALAMRPGDYAAGLQQTTSRTASELEAAGARDIEVREPLAAMTRLIEHHASLLEARAAEGRLRDGHGDLRPEHVFLGTPPAIIDCIEFDRRLRLLDPIDELAFLAMEASRLGQERWGSFFLELYCREADDPAPEELIVFHMCRRALLRAKLALWHLEDTAAPDPDKWRRRTGEYLELANTYARRL